MDRIRRVTSGDTQGISAYTAGPEDAAFGMVIVQEIFGVNAHIRSVVDRYAEAGYRATAPAIFDRIETGVELDYDEAGLERGIELATSLDTSQTLADIQSALDEFARPSGVVGYCYGGSMAWLAASATSALIDQISRFDAFTPDNDPHGEHDFGCIDIGKQKFFWKIDYFDLKLERHSPDAANTDSTHRVLTVMLASEY